jgi:hypothetical protein
MTQAGVSDPPAQAIPQSDLPVEGLQECATTPSHLQANFYLIFLSIFFSGLKCVGYSFAYVVFFERCLNSNPESCHSKLATSPLSPS